MKKFLLFVFVFSLVLANFTGCGERDERQDFIDATTETVCLFFGTEDVFDPGIEKEAKEIYASYGFATDDASIEALTTKYKEDEEVRSSIIAGIEECGGDADLFGEINNTLGDLEIAPPVEEPADETAVEVEPKVDTEAEVEVEAGAEVVE